MRYDHNLRKRDYNEGTVARVSGELKFVEPDNGKLGQLKVDGRIFSLSQAQYKALRQIQDAHQHVDIEVYYGKHSQQILSVNSTIVDNS